MNLLFNWAFDTGIALSRASSLPEELRYSLDDMGLGKVDYNPYSSNRWSSHVPATNQERIFQVIAMIPPGKVATYGQIAELAGLPRAARLVGSVLKGLPKDSKLPWHRVLNASGRTSLPITGNGQVQIARLREEEVIFTNNRVKLSEFGWLPE